jgi:hypothetical protein
VAGDPEVRKKFKDDGVTEMVAPPAMTVRRTGIFTAIPPMTRTSSSLSYTPAARLDAAGVIETVRVVPPEAPDCGVNCSHDGNPTAWILKEADAPVWTI